jgi:hypothetical protein
VLGLAHGSSAALISEDFFGPEDQLIDFEEAAEQGTTVGTGETAVTFTKEGSKDARPWRESDVPGPSSNPTPILDTILRGNVFIEEPRSSQPPFQNPSFSDIGVRFAAPRAAVGVKVAQIIDVLHVGIDLFPGNPLVTALTVQILGLERTLLESVTIQVGPTLQFVGFENGFGITELIVAGSNTGLFAIDDVQAAEVIEGSLPGGNGPEPGALSLLLLGLGAIALGRRQPSQ